MAGHTPGPWIREGLNVWALALDTSGRPVRGGMLNRFYVSVQQCNRDFGGAALDEVEANARLIAESPALLSALEAIVAIIPERFEDETDKLMAFMCAAEAAIPVIAKARGEAS